MLSFYGKWNIIMFYSTKGDNMEEYLEFAKDIARYAGKVMIKYFKEDNHSRYKGIRRLLL